MDHRANCEMKTTKFPEENTGDYHHSTGIGKDFFKQETKITNHKRTNH